jgi:hypothetical protein
MRLIADCVHAGGVVQRQQVHDQALRLLDRRWHSADAPTFDASKESKLLNSMGENWPAEFSVDAYNNHFNLAVSRASRCHLNPLNDDPESMQLRSLWWGAFADPPVESPYFMAAQEARAVTGQHNTTMAHRTAWQAAMIKSITTFVKAGVGKAVGGLSRGQVSARYGGFVPPGLDVDAYAAAAPRAFPGGGRGDGPPRTKLCVRCPLQADGKLTVHDRSFKCDAMADCTGCGSNGHLEHSCWIIHGVPPGTKISAGFHDELTRLHALQKIGKFDWMTTPTTLRWMESARLRKGASAGSVAASVAGMCEDMEAEMAYAESCGFQPLPLSTGPTAMLPATPVIYPGVVGGNVAESIAGSGVSDVYRSMLAFDGIVGGNAASANDVHEHVWRASSANCGTCGDRAGEMCGGCSATWCSCSGLVVPPPRGVPTPGPVMLPAPPPFPFVPPASAPRFASTADPGVEARMVVPAVAGGGGGAPYLVALPCIVRVAMWGLLVLMMVVPCWAWLIRTDHSLLDSAYAALVAWSPRFSALLVVVWQYVVHLHGAIWATLPMAVVTIGLLGVFAGDTVLALVRSEVAGAVAALRAARRNVLRIPQRIPWLVLVMLGVVHIVRSSPPPSVSSSALQLPSVVSCSYPIGALTRGVVKPSAARAVVGAFDARLLPGGGNGTWAARLPHGTWVVDSGAELMIAGKFIYPYSTVVERRPDVSIKGVDGALTRVDNVVRTMVRLPDGDHCVREILVCDAFEIALWSTEYMACFGFCALLMPAGKESVVRTPGGCDVALGHRPYRLLAPCRVPTRAEFSSSASVVSADAVALAAVGTAAGVPLPRQLTSH